MRRNKILALLLTLLLALVAVGCGGQKIQGTGDKTDSTSEPAPAATEIKYPEREITMIIPQAPGGSTDMLGRTIAKFAEKHLGQPIVIVNREGGGMTIATTEAAQAKPDGYTIILNNIGVFTLIPHLSPVNYSLDQFAGIMNLTTEPILVVARTDSPWTNIKALIEDYKASGKELKYGHPGTGNLPHLAQADLYAKNGIKATPVPFKGGAPAVQALLGGNVDVSSAFPAEALPHVQAGTLCILGVFSNTRQVEVPDVPTMKEQVGYDTEWQTWKFLMAPAGTPKEILTKLHDAFKAAMDDPEFQEALKTINLTPYYLPGDELVERLKTQAEITGAVIEAAGLKN